jgi:hypothetical protein
MVNMAEESSNHEPEMRQEVFDHLHQVSHNQRRARHNLGLPRRSRRQPPRNSTASNRGASSPRATGPAL